MRRIMKQEIEKQHMFVGREQELQDLLDFVHGAFEGKAGVGFITGEAGIGKTALVGELLRRLRKERETLVIAAGECSVQSASYLPFQGILENLLDSQKQVGLSGKRIKKVAEVVLDTIWNVGPDLIGVFGVPVKVLQSVVDKLGWRGKKSVGELEIPKDLDQHKIFGWYTKVMKDISAQFPLVLFIDDLHWADDSSLNLLLHLGRELEQEQMVVLGTFRPYEADPNGLLLQVKATLGRYGARDFSLDISQKNAQDVARAQQFVHDYLLARYNTNFSDQFERLLADRSEGNALFLTEMLLNMEEKGQIQRTALVEENDPDNWQLADPDIFHNLPHKVEQAIEERVNRLETTLREVLEYASVEGDEFIAQVIAQVRQIQERTLLNDLTRKLMKTYHLIYERGGKSLSNGSRVHEFAFKHNLIREYLYANLSDTDKELLHADIGECLEQLYEPNNFEIAAKLAIHFSKGYVVDKAVRYCLLAAENANRSYGASEAVHFGKMGLNALEQQKRMLSEADYAEQKVRLLLELAKAEEFGGDLQEGKNHISAGIQYIENNLELIEQISMPVQAAAYMQLGKLYIRQSNRNRVDAKEYLEKALSLYEQSENKAKIAESLYLLGNVYLYIPCSEDDPISPLQKSIEAVRKSLNFAETLNDVELQVKCLNSLTWKCVSNDFIRAEEYLSRANAIVQDSESISVYTKIKFLTTMAGFYRRKALHQSALQYLEQAFPLIQQVGDKYLQFSIINDIAIDYMRYAKLLNKAKELLKNNLIDRERLGFSIEDPSANLGWILVIQGFWRDAEECFQNCMTGDAEIFQLAKRLMWINMLQGKYCLAEENFLSGYKVLLSYREKPALIDYARFCQNLALMGKYSECREFLQKAQEEFERNTQPRSRWVYLYHLAEIYRILGSIDAAKDTCQESINSFFDYAEDAEELIYVAEARLVMGKILVDMQDYAAAILPLKKAKSVFEICRHYALGETLFYLSKAQLGLGHRSEAQGLTEKALAEFRRLELAHKIQESGRFMEELKKSQISRTNQED